MARLWVGFWVLCTQLNKSAARVLILLCYLSLFQLGGSFVSMVHKLYLIRKPTAT